ncbi:hypothetical protein BSNK01_26280 [Bacillaceae bacterium]
MSKHAWKWILSVIPDQELGRMINRIGIEIPGVRKNHIPNSKIFKPRIISTVLQPKNLFKLQKHLQTMIHEKEEWKKLIPIREMEAHDIQESMQKNGWLLSDVLIVLLCSPEPNHQQKGEQLFETLKNTDSLFLSENEEKMISRRSSPETETHKEAEKANLTSNKLEELQKRLEETESKVRFLEENIKELQKRHEMDKNNWQIAKENFKNIINNLKKEIQKKDVALQQKEKQQSRLEEELLANDKTLKQTQELVQQKEKQIEILEKKLEQYKEKVKGMEDELDQYKKLLQNLFNQESTAKIHRTQPLPKKKIALIGNPKNNRIYEFEHYELNIIEAFDLEQAIENRQLQSADEIWMLTYKIPSMKQQRVREYVEQGKLREFNNFIELHKYMSIKG